MGITAENLAEMYHISREDQDVFSYDSQMRTKAAMEQGLYKNVIVPVRIPGDKKNPALIFKRTNSRGLILPSKVFQSWNLHSKRAGQ